ncbi:unnamed protein product [Protopolystoma xenopodis]|uniref:Uncharacterized protein n=1 Tax=Protopolystoma xenopodis TaxID=117903 RepID=A0A3S5BLD7_9PLAT|nr:unnamed protein product [Protopolystoma xenopodis]
MDYAEACREIDMEQLASAVDTLTTSSLGKLEEALYDRNTGRCEQMCAVYWKFEEHIMQKLRDVSSNINGFIWSSACH